MTTKDAILKLADAVSGNTSANVATDVQALAVLAQAMTGGVPAEPLATVDDAIGYIADNYTGGGGGVDVGAMSECFTDTMEPTVGHVIFDGFAIAVIKIGDAVIVDTSPYGSLWLAASGVAAITAMYPAEDANTASAYVCTFELDADENKVYKTVEPWDGTITREEVEQQGATYYRWAYTVPALDDGESLVIWPHVAT